jgi:predicted acyl esterase
MRHQHVTSPDSDGPGARERSAAPRPLGRAADAVSKALSRAWELPPRRNFVAAERGLRVPMSDGAVLLADHYMPITAQPAATVLVRCPYGRGVPFGLLDAQIIAERGYHVLLQSVRGTFGSGGDFEPMRHEAADGQDTVAWLRGQTWFDGRLATYGGSYLGFVQWALALNPPPELVAAIVHVGPHDLSRSVYRNGVFALYDTLGWADLVARQEHGGPLLGAVRTATADRRLRPALDQVPVSAGARALLGEQSSFFGRWLEHPQLTDPYWEPLQCGAALERISVPTLLVGGWQDLFLEQTLEQYCALAARRLPVRLVVGPWNHVDSVRKGGEAVAESLAWLDRYAGSGFPGTAGTATASVRIWVGSAPEEPEDPKSLDELIEPVEPADLEVSKASKAIKGLKGLRGLRGLAGRRSPRAFAGEWREVSDWPPAGTGQQRWYLGVGGTLSPREPDADPDVPPASFRYDPADPTPTVGGATLALNAGTHDNQAVEQRPDVLVFTSEPLPEPVEVIGYVAAELSVTRDNPYADLFVRLCDVDPRGRSRNVCDGIVRLTEQDPLTGTVRVSLLGTAHRFGRGHRLRLQVAGGAHPRFSRNPGNGRVDAPAADLVPTRYAVRLGAGTASVLLLPVAAQATEQTAEQTTGTAAAHA